MSSLVSLPTELLTLILSRLSKHDELPTILAIRATSRKFNALASPFFYYSITGSTYPTSSSVVRGQPWPLQRAAVTIAEDPALAKFVKEINLIVGPSRGSNALVYSHSERLEIAANAADVIKRVRLPQDLNGRIGTAMWVENRDGYLMFLLYLCQFLEVLHLEILGSSSVLELFAIAAERYIGPSPSDDFLMLGVLKKVNIGVLGVSNVLDVLALPNLT